jgi:hypothetical protein
MLPSQVYFITKLHLTKGQPKNNTFLPTNLSTVFVFEAYYATVDELIADLLQPQHQSLFKFTARLLRIILEAMLAACY